MLSTNKNKYNISDLLEIMKLLRSENGCLWDREQNHNSIRNNMLEESYEVCDAIDRDDDTALCEELGDVLLQVVFHSQMASEQNSFDFDDVADGICKKLILRHPHVFGDVQVSDTNEVLSNWEAIKNKEKGQATVMDTLLSVPRAFPALMRTQKLCKRAAKSENSLEELEYSLDSTVSNIGALQNAVKIDEETAGDMLLSLVNAFRLLDIDAEEALSKANNRFISKFDKSIS